MSWKLPSSPDSHLYREALIEIDLTHSGTAATPADPRRAMAMFRALAEADMWFHMKYNTSLGQYRIKERTHPRRGGLWVDEPDFFDMIRAAQWVIEEKIDPALFYVHRYGLKSSGIVKCGILWVLSRDAQETNSIHTHKTEQVGESFGGDILSEMQNSETLLSHWPQFRQIEEASDTRITISRKPGPREPSVSVLPILSSAASIHPGRIWVDDPVSEKIAESATLCKQVDDQLKLLIPLRGDDTPMLFVGMPFGKLDPVYRRYKDGFFKFVHFAPCYKRDGTPHLHSREFFEKQRKEIKDPYLFSCHYELNPTQRGDRYFQDHWWRSYRGTPEQAAHGCRIHAILDPAGGKDKKSDFTSLRVVGMHPEKKRRNLDLWREKIGMSDTMDLIFGAPRGGACASWIPREGIAKRWLAIDPEFTLWVEDFGNSAWYQAIRREALQRKTWFTIRKLPAVGNRQKASRIRFLQNPYRDGEIEYPEGGFGHGSYTTEDDRDTMRQYKEEQYSQWVFNPENPELSGVTNDDDLDTEAWHVQPEMRLFMPYPERDPYEEGGGDFWSIPGMESAGGIPWASISWRAM